MLNNDSHACTIAHPSNLGRGEERVTAHDGLSAWGNPSAGWYVLGRQHGVMAHYDEPELGALAALDRYRMQSVEAEERSAMD